MRRGRRPLVFVRLDEVSFGLLVDDAAAVDVLVKHDTLGVGRRQDAEVVFYVHPHRPSLRCELPWMFFPT